MKSRWVQGEPAARPQQPGGLAERDPGIDPVERSAGDNQVKGRIGHGQILERGDPERDFRDRQAPPGGSSRRYAPIRVRPLSAAGSRQPIWESMPTVEAPPVNQIELAAPGAIASGP
jgi:hypothetical protein